MAASGSNWNARKHDNSDLQPKRYGSYGRESSSGSSIGRFSFGLPGEIHSHFNEGAENKHVSQLDDVEERALLSRAHNLSVSHPLSVENVTENGAVSGQVRHSSVGRASSSGASLRRLFSLSSAPCSQRDEDVESEIVSQAGDIGDRALQHRAHNLNVSHPLSVENVLQNGAVSGQVRHSYSERQASSSVASLRRLFSLPSAHCFQLDEDVESEIVSQAGDIGDRALSSRKGSLGESAHFPTEKGLVFPIPEELLESYGFWKHDPSNSLNNCPVSPLVEEIITPPSTDALLKKKQEEKKEKPPFEYLSCLVHLAVFGILGVLTRYLLQKLFGPGVAGVTRDQAILYLDLPANMVGSFLMGWFGVVFKADISSMSDQLLIGLSTGYLGSLTTFSSWNQKMVELSAKGRWVFAVTGVVIGLFLCAYSIIFGIETAKGFRWLLTKARKGSTTSTWSLTSKKHHLIALLSLLLIWGGLLVTSAVLEHKDFKHGGSAAQLWVACLVGPLGVWIRWWLARLNGRGIGKAGWCKWIPFGTLYANVSAASVMAALATVKKAVNTKNCDTIAAGIQFGLMGCLSTVSTFMAEFNAMRNSAHPWRAYAYAAITIGMSFALGTLIYSVPVWAKNYK